MQWLHHNTLVLASQVLHELTEDVFVLERTASLTSAAPYSPGGESHRRRIQLVSLAFRLRDGDTQCVGVTSLVAYPSRVVGVSDADDRVITSVAWAADECECWFFTPSDALATPSISGSKWSVRYAGYQPVADPHGAATAASSRCDPDVAARLSQLALDVIATPQLVEQDV